MEKNAAKNSVPASQMANGAEMGETGTFKSSPVNAGVSPCIIAITLPMGVCPECAAVRSKKEYTLRADGTETGMSNLKMVIHHKIKKVLFGNRLTATARIKRMNKISTAPEMLICSKLICVTSLEFPNDLL